MSRRSRIRLPAGARRFRRSGPRDLLPAGRSPPRHRRDARPPRRVRGRREPARAARGTISTLDPTALLTDHRAGSHDVTTGCLRHPWPAVEFTGTSPVWPRTAAAASATAQARSRCRRPDRCAVYGPSATGLVKDSVQLEAPETRAGGPGTVELSRDVLAEIVARPDARVWLTSRRTVSSFSARSGNSSTARHGVDRPATGHRPSSRGRAASSRRCKARHLDDPHRTGRSAQQRSAGGHQGVQGEVQRRDVRPRAAIRDR
ncbi:hypothetical protein B046DRAFT_00023 [Streptomyces sp. LamerLS-316]|nr:hypothetical protein B046DRAFT_00023 [Streptomyces sp. LamerLS-316]